MIRSKQMDELRKAHQTLRNLGSVNRPSLEQHVMLAITSGEVPKLKPVAAITATSRKKIVAGGYSSSRTLSFGDVFASCNGYEAEMKQFDAYEKHRKSALARYDILAEKILLRAGNKDADVEEISEALHEAAEKSGLKTLTPPVFGVGESEGG